MMVGSHPAGAALVARALMQLEASHASVAVICEGKIDKWFVKSLLGPHAVGVDAGGRKQVIQGANAAPTNDLPRLAFLIDRDFTDGRILVGSADCRSRVVETDHPSLESDLASAGLLLQAVEAILAQRDHAGSTAPEIVGHATKLAHAKGRLRAFAAANGLQMRFKALRPLDLVNGSVAPDVDAILRAVARKCNAGSPPGLIAHVNTFLTEEPSLDFCDGHDLIDSLSFVLRELEVDRKASTKSIEQAFYHALHIGPAGLHDLGVVRRLRSVAFSQPTA